MKLRRVTASMAVAFAVTLLANIYVVAMSGGFNDAPRYSFIVARASSANASLFWGAAAALVTAMVMAWRRRGPSGVWRALAGTPGGIRRAVASPWTRLGLLLGFVAAYWVVSPSLTRVVLLTASLALIVFGPSRGLSVLLMRVAAPLGQGARRSEARRVFTAMVRGMLLGSAAALMLTGFVGADDMRKLVAFGAIGGLWFWSRNAPLPRAAVAALWALAVVHVMTDWLAAPLSADDGTWRDDSTVRSWWDDGGNEITTMSGEPATVSSLTAATTAAADEDEEVISPGTVDDLLGAPPPEPHAPTPTRPIIDRPLGEDPPGGGIR